MKSASQDSQRPVGVGIIGLGWWSGVLADSMKDIPAIRLSAAFSRSRGKTTAFARRYLCHGAASLDELLSLPQLEAVLITTPNGAHREIAEAAARAGKHVFVEKPIANTIDDGHRIIAACANAGVVLSVGHSYRRHAGLRRLRELIESDAIGRVSLAEAVFSKDHGLALSDTRDWRFRRSEMPGGCLMQIGIHQIDDLLYLMGGVEEISGMMARLETQADIDDVAAVLLRFGCGALGVVSADYVTADRFALTLYGTKAAAQFDLHAGLAIRPRGATAWQPLAVTPNDYVRAELEEFADCIRLGTRPEVGGREALVALAVVHAAIRSATTKQVVRLDEVLRSGRDEREAF